MQNNLHILNKSCNFAAIWKISTMEELLHREYYTQAIAKWLGKQIIIVLTGQRRVGKFILAPRINQSAAAGPFIFVSTI